MSAHVTPEQLRRIAANDLSAAQTAEARRHADTCEACSDLLMDHAGEAASRVGAILMRELEEDAGHPDEARLRALAGNTLDAAEREIVESHVEDCDSCRSTLATLGKRPRVPAMAIAAGAAIAVATVLLWPRDPAPPARPVAAAPAAIRKTPVPAPAVVAAPPRYANVEWERLVEDARRSGRLPIAAVAGVVRAEPGRLRGKPVPRADALAPAGVVIETVRPELTWPATDGAAYVVSMFEGDREVARSPRLTRNRWTPERALRRGRIYVWQVEVLRGETSEIIPQPPAPQALFAVVAAEAQRALQAARAAHPDDHLLLAVLYARAGMEREANEELARVDKNEL